MTIHEKLSLIQKEFKAKKSRYNSFGKYNFRSAEDILEALKPFNKKYDVYFTVKENLTVMGVDFPIIHSTAIMVDAKSGETIEATAIVGVDLNAKGQQMPQRFGSASSYGKKYALGNLLLIDDTADSDAINTHGKSSSASFPPTKPSLKRNSDEWQSALDYVKDNGKGSTSKIESKYNISDKDKLFLESHEIRHASL